MSNRNLSLRQHLDAGQLPMFMTAPEIKARYKPMDYTPSRHSNYDDMWKEKSQEANTGLEGDSRIVSPGRNGDKTLVESIKKNGIVRPVLLSERSIFNGHHRIQAAHEIDPKMLIPVEHV